MNKIWRIIDIINWGTNYLDSKKIEDARINIELILSNVLNSTKLNLYLNFEKPLSTKELEQIKFLIQKRVKKEPIQYVLGEAFFLNYKLFVNNSVLIPRPETEILVQSIFNIYHQNQNLKILDIGTGSGCISISLADYFKNSIIHSVDVSEQALEIARINAQKYNLNNIKFEYLDILERVPSQKYDIIVSNPPYISLTELKQCSQEILNYEPQIALTDNDDGLTFYRRYSEIFKELMEAKSQFFLEIAYNQSKDLLKIFNKSYIVEIYNDYSNIPRFLRGKIQ